MTGEINEADATNVIEVKENQKPKKIRYIYGLIIPLAIIIILIIIAAANPAFPFKTAIIISIIIAIIGAGLFFSFNIYSKFKNMFKNEGGEITGLPKISSKEEIENELNKYILKKFNHIKQIKKVEPFSVNGNNILAYNLDLLYPDGDNGKNVWVVINTNFLKEKEFGYFSGNVTINNLKRVANGLGGINEETPDIEETTTINPSLGVETTHRKRTYKKRNKESEENKKTEEIK